MRFPFLIILLILSFSATAQHPLYPNKDGANQKDQLQVYGISFHYGAVLVHSNEVKSIQHAKPAGISFDWSKQFIDSLSYTYCRAYIRKGFTLYFYDLGTSILGNAFIVSYFLEPVYRIGKRFQFQFRGDMGAGYFSNPYDTVKNPKNKNYSLHITPSLHVSAGFGYHINKKLILAGNANFNHMSNGGYKEPNGGLNWSTFSAALLYYPNNNQLPKYNKPSRYKWSEKKAGIDVGLMFVPKQGYHYKWQTTRNYMIGFFIVSTKKISRISAVSAGTEAYYNKFIDAPGVASGNSKPATLASVFFGHEFLINKIIFSQQVGRYITHYPAFLKYAIYHRWGLRYRLNSRLYAGFNLKVHRYTADFIDLRLQYKIF